MTDARSLLTEIVALLLERHGGADYTWTHDHCDEDSGGNHRLDGQWLDEDIEAWLRKARPFVEQRP